MLPALRWVIRAGSRVPYPNWVDSRPNGSRLRVLRVRQNSKLSVSGPAQWQKIFEVIALEDIPYKIIQSGREPEVG